MLRLLCAILFASTATCNGYPTQGFKYYHPGTIMMGGYLGIPAMKTPMYNPQIYEPQPAESENEFTKEAVTESAFDVPEEIEETKEPSTPAATPNVPRKSKAKESVVPRKSTRPKTGADSDEEDSSDNNFPFGMGGSSLFNTFFPVMVGGNTGARGKSDDGGPGGATAIANSFSTGRGGVATSHATSFGDVFLSSAQSKRLKKNM